MTDPVSRDCLCPSLRSAREKLCVAQTDLPTNAPGRAHRQALQDALNTIDRIGVFHCPDWSTFNEPPTAFDYGPQFGEESDD